ncbi:MAG: tRNA dihydrouridine(20/20a) synthase DusA [Xanthomonadales bacterium]|nr:tRNA dihydrouridine(20/20a) synthase DusA [Xanthomonadales bacterium]
MTNQGFTFSVAPMMDWTDRHCRYFHRWLNADLLLYTEMVTTGAVLHGDLEKLLAFDPAEKPLILQLGGGDPDDLAKSALIAQDWGYSGVNLNVGCPSDRVQKGKMGACLMKEPSLVADCIEAMAVAVDIPVTVKTRLGVDELDSYEYFRDFVATIAAIGCRDFIVHARKALLSGLSPKQNRDIPPLRYEWVYRLKQEFPELNITLNGGVTDINSIHTHLQYVDGVMLGRAAYKNPWLLAELSGDTTLERDEVVLAMAEYADRLPGVPVKHISRHMLGLYHGQPGAKHWRRFISDNAFRYDSGGDLLRKALQALVHIRDSNQARDA